MKDNDSIYISDEYKDAINKLNEHIAIQQKAQNNYVTYSKEYQKALKKEINLLKEKLELTNKQNNVLEKVINEDK